MFGLPDDTVDRIRRVLARHPQVDRAILYGSRAKGTHRNGSDIDLTLDGEDLTVALMLQVESELDDLDLPYQLDLSVLHQIEDPDLRAHISRVGQVLYLRAAAPR